MKFPTISTIGSAVLAGISLVTPAFAVINIDYASIGNAGNTNDAATGSLRHPDLPPDHCGFADRREETK